jgi:hypothetical protein
MSQEPVDYSSWTLAELRDVAAHIDRERFAERAERVDLEIRRREALPISNQESISFRGGLRAGVSLYFERTATWPLVALSFSTTILMIRPSKLALMRSFTFRREEVRSLQQHARFFIRGFQVVHTRTEYPPVILFLALDPEPIRKALLERGWKVEPAARTKLHTPNIL